MDYTQLHWQSDWAYSEIYGFLPKTKEDFAVGHYKLRGFPEVNMYIDMEDGKVIEVWLNEKG